MNRYQRQPMWPLNKRAVAILTPEAMQAAMQPPPPDPAAMGGAPMDPAMAGGMPPMDPAMAGGAPMPPQGGAPAGGLPPEAMQDPMFIQFLAEAFGIMLDPRSGQFFDQNGQPVPPDMLMQAFDAYMQAMQQLQGQGGMPPAGGAPMDPSMMGGQPPMDPAMAGGMPPMDPAAMGGAPTPPAGGMPPMDPAMAGGQPTMDPAMAGGAQMPPAGGAPMDPGMTAPPPEGGEQEMDPMMQDFASMIVTAMEDTVVTPLKEELSNIMKQFSDLKEALKTIRDDMGTIRTDVDAQESRADEESMLRSQLAEELKPTIDTEPESKPESEGQPKQAALRPLNILDILGSK